MNTPSFTFSTDTITLVYEGKTHVVKRGSPNFEGLRQALTEKRFKDIPKYLTVAQTIKSWGNHGEFTLVDNNVVYKGEPLPDVLTKRIMNMVTNGNNPISICFFWERLQKNPSFRSVRQLFGFLEHMGIPLTPDGCFLAYKGVKSDYKDIHSGQFDNKPGQTLEMPRNKISDDPDLPCHEGFHVGDLSYAQKFAGTGRVVIVKVDPEHVVCVPKDESQKKMRVCRYEVLGNYGTKLPDTTYEEDSGSPVKTTSPKKTKEKTPKTTVAKSGNWTHFDKMDMPKLLDQSLESLRKYAALDLKIVGASKIPGGKVALINAILKNRS